KFIASLVKVDVENLINYIKEPGEGELTRFYDGNRDKTYDAKAKVPGYKMPARAKFEWVAMPVDNSDAKKKAAGLLKALSWAGVPGIEIVGAKAVQGLGFPFVPAYFGIPDEIVLHAEFASLEREIKGKAGEWERFALERDRWAAEDFQLVLQKMFGWDKRLARHASIPGQVWGNLVSGGALTAAAGVAPLTNRSDNANPFEIIPQIFAVTDFASAMAFRAPVLTAIPPVPAEAVILASFTPDNAKKRLKVLQTAGGWGGLAGT